MNYGVQRMDAASAERTQAVAQEAGARFLPLFYCNGCGPTNHVVEKPDGEFVCARCHSALARSLAHPVIGY